ncbi:MAG TPA: M13 family metallopeptidase [Gemmatimonadaceae bacterium]|nr:M13 family metallopeptidase [Gemmatimonadaceae bacterium]
MTIRSLLVACLLAAAPLGAQSAVPMPALDPRNIDRNYGACDDFFMFATNGWIERNPIPATLPGWSTFDELSGRNTVVLRGIAERAAAQAATTADPVTRRLGTFYASCMDSVAADRAGVAPIADELRRIEAITDRVALQDQIARLHLLGYGAAFGFGAAPDARNARMMIADVSQGGLGLPDREHYLRDDEEAKRLRARYAGAIAEMLALAGDPDTIAATKAARILELETALARAQRSRAAMRDASARNHTMTIAEATANSPGFDWRRYLAALGLSHVDSINIGVPPYYAALGAELASRPVNDWKAYLRWNVLRGSAPDLSTPFTDAAFRLSAMLTGAREQQPRWRRCLATTNQLLGDALGREYVKTEFTPEARAKMLALIGNLRGVLRDRIARADWMSDRTRAEALAKLDAFGQKVGYPDRWQDYAGLDIRPGPFAANLQRAREFLVRADLARVGRPTERDRWRMTPPTVNAYYDLARNEIVFPAGRLQPPFFSVAYDDGANYGGIGTAIGHEMSHGFDDLGRQYDAAGNVRDWWTPDDARRYRERAAVVERQYGSYVVIDTLRINGRLTLGENIADVVGVSLAYEAMQRALRGRPRTTIDGFTPEQRFFLAYAQTRLSVQRPESVRLSLATAVHSPSRYRINGPLSNMPDFARAFGCKEGDPMVRPASERAAIW